MRKHGSKLIKSRACAGRMSARPHHLQLKDEDTTSLDSASGDYEGGATSKDTLLKREDADDDSGYNVYEADSENEDDSHEDPANDNDPDGDDEDEDDGYLFVDHCKETKLRQDAVLDLEDVDESEEEEDLRTCLRIHRESGKFYSRVSDVDHDLAKVNGCTDQVMLRYILDKKIKVNKQTQKIILRRPANESNPIKVAPTLLIINIITPE